MTTIVVPCETPAAWHAERAKYLGASDVPTLFGHGYLSRLQLWRLKKGLDQPQPPSERMLLGLDLEDGIGRAYARATGRRVVTPQLYFGEPEAHAIILRNVQVGVQCTPDRIILAEDSDAWPLSSRKGAESDRLLQLKNYGSWAIDEWNETGEPPIGVQIQVQAELLASGREHASIGCLIGRDELRTLDVQRHPDFQELLVQEIRLFAEQLAGDQPPEATGQDLEPIKRMFPESAPGLSFEYQQPEDFMELARIKAQIAQLEELESVLLARIQSQAGPAETITSHGRKMATWKSTVRRDPPREAREYPVRAFRLAADLMKAAKAALPEPTKTPLLPA
jgi:predicted phage-related endonuclease